MPTVNETLLNEWVKHQINLLRYRGGLTKSLVKELNKTEAKISREIKLAYSTATGLNSEKDWQRLERLLARLEKIRAKSWENLSAIMLAEMEGLSEQESDFNEEILLAALFFLVIKPKKLTAAQRNVIVRRRPMEGRTLEQWLAHGQAEDARRIRSVITAGVGAGQTGGQIARAVVGRQVVKGTDGATQATRNAIAALAGTAITHVTTGVQKRFIQRNEELLQKVRFTAVLDGKTTALCRSLDGNIYLAGKGPLPPLHFNCRSIRVPYVDARTIERMALRPEFRNELARRYAAQNNLPLTTVRSGAHKAAFDVWAKQEVRDMVGPAVKKTIYADWLRKQPYSVQQDILGKTKAKLFKDGKLALDKFVDRAGNELSLSELAKLNSSAFRQAGLDPKQFNQ